VSTDSEEVKTLICLETIAAIPVTTTFHKSMCTFDRLLHQKLVAKEETQADDGEDDVNLGSKNTGLLEYRFVSCECFVLL